MDTNKMRPILDAKSNTEANNWKSKERRNIMVKKIADFLIKRGNPSWTQNLHALIKVIERVEKDVFASANNEDEYIARISTKIKATRTVYQSDESNILPSNVFGSGTEIVANTEWQEHIYQKIQTIKNKNFSRLNILYNGICNRLQQHDESAPQQPKISSIVKCKQHKHTLECIFAIFKVNKSQITPDVEQKLDKVEKYIHSIEQTKYVSPHSKVSRGEEASAKKPTSQLMGQRSSHFTKQDFSQVAIEFSNSHPWPNLVSDKQGCENVVRQQTSGEIASPIINSSQILASSLIGSCNDQVKENSLDHINITADSSPEMQNLLKLLSSVSVETLVACCGDIGMLVHLNDNMSTLEPLIGPPIGSIGSDLEGVSVTDSQARYFSHGKFVPRERKLNHFINSMSTNDNYVHLTSTEKSFSKSNISQENNVLSQEIKEINKRLMDTEVVVDREKILLPIAGGDTEHGKEFIVKLCFNSVTINPNPMSKYTSPYKKLIIEPLWLHIPTSYPHCSVVILDEMPSDVSKDLDELSVKAKLKLRLSLLRLSEPLSLKDIATLWDHCAREAICEHAELLGGGTFTSKYGGWETCLDDAS